MYVTSILNVQSLGEDCNFTCEATSCRQDCRRGGCKMDCCANRCYQRCPGGGCTLQCLSHASRCEQFCDFRSSTRPCRKVIVNNCTLPFIPPECNHVSHGVCLQSCTQGGCNLKCHNSTHYHSCRQSCTGKY